MIEELAGFNKMTYCVYFKQWFIGIFVALIMYWALIVLMLTIIVFTPIEYLMFVIGVATLVVSLLLLILFPACISPCFNSHKPLEEGELRSKIEKMSKENKYKPKQIYLQEDSKYTEHSNAHCTFSKIHLSDNLLKHHEDHKEILAIVLHEICHDKRKHLIQSALVDVVYMVLYGVGLAAMVEYGDFIISSFGFSY